MCGELLSLLSDSIRMSILSILCLFIVVHSDSLLSCESEFYEGTYESEPTASDVISQPSSAESSVPAWLKAVSICNVIMNGSLMCFTYVHNYMLQDSETK